MRNYAWLAGLGARTLLFIAFFLLFRSLSGCWGEGSSSAEGQLRSQGSTKPATWLQWDRTSDGAFAFAGFVIVMWWAGRFYLYERYGRNAFVQAKRGDEVLQLMPSQEGSLSELKDIVDRRTTSSPPLMVAMRGSWGCGKSFILDRLRQDLENSQESAATGPAVVVAVDIWKHSTEEDLHLALFESLLSHPRVPPFPALLRYPMTLLPAIFLRYVNKILHRGRFELRGLKLLLGMPATLWQDSLEYTVATVRGRGSKVVWILDEIDRCAPAMAQAAISLAKRALSLPGTVVILPYVPEQLRFKVFNPLAPGRPDVFSTLHAMIADFRQLRQEPLLEKSLQEFWSYNWSPSRSSNSSDEDADRIETDLQSEPAATLGRSFVWKNSEWYVGVEPSVRFRLALLFEEKYLSMEVRVQALGNGDIVHMLSEFPTLRKLFGTLSGLLVRVIEDEAGRDLTAEDVTKLLKDDIVAALEAYQKYYGGRDAPEPSIRHLEGALRTSLSMVSTQFVDRLVEQKDSRYLRTCIAVGVILGYRRAQEIARRRPFNE